MFICICNGFTDRQIKGAVREGTAHSVSDVYRCMGCKPQCGRCAPPVRKEAALPAAGGCSAGEINHAPAKPPCRANEVLFADAAE